MTSLTTPRWRSKKFGFRILYGTRQNQINRATNRSLTAVREQILFAYAENVIDADEFSLLNDANQSKPIYPYWKYNTFDVGIIDDEHSFIDFRFGKNDLYTLWTFLIYPTE